MMKRADAQIAMLLSGISAMHSVQRPQQRRRCRRRPAHARQAVPAMAGLMIAWFSLSFSNAFILTKPRPAPAICSDDIMTAVGVIPVSESKLVSSFFKTIDKTVLMDRQVSFPLGNPTMNHAGRLIMSANNDFGGSNSTEGGPNPNKEEDVDDDNLSERRRIAAARTALLNKRASPRTVGDDASPRRDSSVGARRVGSAKKACQDASASSRLAQGLRRTAQGVARFTRKSEDVAAVPEPPSPTPPPMHVNSKVDDTHDPSHPPLSARLSSTTIQTAIDELLRRGKLGAETLPRRNFQHEQLSKAISKFGRSMGLFGRAEREVIVPALTTDAVRATTTSDTVAVRLAAPSDDVYVANLRLSVFPEFDPTLRAQFCSRSCHAIAQRRLRGALGVVAVDERSRRSLSPSASLPILGSAECSFHEFFGTRLGQRRPQQSILYVTEVAVSPAARRRGVGTKLLHALDRLADESDIETLYLHVDVKNTAAIALYQKAGYKRVRSKDPIFVEFTTSLNLHPGATRGRSHYLFYKNLTTEPTWLAPPLRPSQLYAVDNRQRRPLSPVPAVLSNHVLGQLGIEIPA